MKKFFWSLGCFLVTFFALLFFLGPKSDNNNSSAEAKKQQSYLEESPNTIFVVSEYQGNIAIFEKNKPSPIKVTDVQIIDLPKQDRELLKKGIQVNTKEELSNILEDYCS